MAGSDINDADSSDSVMRISYINSKVLALNNSTGTHTDQFLSHII
jgi:hypothetical protein